ncbi:hypothetical protein [Paramesorhizobium deserti]|uniref:hypothetical protein n=1 Tax=Paramesorhizobium deserti TaxID=1494590 RepID=UPI00137ACAC6|nr:hypothetical protein [Paramesorhizobium deserti]
MNAATNQTRVRMTKVAVSHGGDSPAAIGKPKNNSIFVDPDIKLLVTLIDYTRLP